MKRAAEHTTCIKKCLCGFSFNPKQIFKMLQSQKLKLLRTVTHRPKLFCCALCIYDSCQACQSLSGFLCVRSQCSQWWMFAFERSDILMRHWGPSENQMKKRGAREMGWEKGCGLKQAERVQMLKRSGAWKGGSSAERRKGKDGWDGSFGWVDLYGGEHWHLFTMFFLYIHHKRQF